MNRAKSCLAGVMVLGAAMQAAATENYGGAYPNGAEGIMAGALPPPGQYIINYAMYYGAEALNGGNGHTIPGADFTLRAYADTVRFVNVTEITVLGGSWAQHIFVPMVGLNASVNTPGGRIKDANFGLGDIIVDPFIVGWHQPPFHWVVGLDVYIPVGKYHDTSFANIGRNYWTFEPVAGVTYLNEGGQEVSAKLMYDFNTRNPDTDYTSGQEFHTDFFVGQHLGNWTVGAGGYWYCQTTDDRQNGAVAMGNGNRGRQVALGPQASYQCGPLNVSLAWDREFATENRPQGDKVWLKAVIPL
ncbi:MAG: transporter [bacterium]